MLLYGVARVDLLPPKVRQQLLWCGAELGRQRISQAMGAVGAEDERTVTLFRATKSRCRRDTCLAHAAFARMYEYAHIDLRPALRMAIVRVAYYAILTVLGDEGL